MTATTLAACAAAGGDAGTSSSSDSGVLTIQGDAGNPTLVENFNPFSTTQLEGTRLIYEPLEISEHRRRHLYAVPRHGHTSSPTRRRSSTRSGQGVKWSDGKPFTASDVVFTFNLLKKDPALDTTGVWAQLKSVTASGRQGHGHLQGT